MLIMLQESPSRSLHVDKQLKGIFNLRLEWVKELKNEGVVKAVHVATDRNLADMLTKGLTAEVRSKLEKCLETVANTIATGLGYLGGT